MSMFKFISCRADGEYMVYLRDTDQILGVVFRWGNKWQSLDLPHVSLNTRDAIALALRRKFYLF